jgi:hypothetical protein
MRATLEVEAKIWKPVLAAIEKNHQHLIEK